MTRIQIPLDPDISLPDLPEGSDTKLAQYQPFLDKLGTALESERGIKLTYRSKAEASNARMRFYTARRYVARQGITSFAGLTLLVEGCTLLIRKDAPPVIEEL